MTILNKRLKIKDIHFRIQEEDYLAIQEAAKDRSLPIVTLVRQILKQWLKQNASPSS
jgi:predicted DNA binding CopG/RHH family protein